MLLIKIKSDFWKRLATNKMDKLFPELLEMILKCLSVNDILNCRLVNKQFYSVVKALKLSSLVISDHSFRARHFHSYLLVDYHHLVKINTYRPFEPILNEKIFLNLKSLFVDFSRVCMEIESSESINRFRRLERLELNGLNLKNLPNFVISLPFLKTLSIQNFDSYSPPNQPDCKIVINSPNLRNLKIANRKTYKISFVFAECVRFLEIFEWQDFVCDLVKLEYFYCARTKGLANERDFLCKLERLKEVHMDAQKHVFDDLVEQKRRLRRQNPKIFVLGVDFEHGAPNHFPWPDYTDLDEEWMAAFYWENRTKFACHLPFVNVIDYDVLEMHFGDQLPAQFGRRFVGLYQLRVTGVQQQSQFIAFLSDCRFIRNLYLEAAQLDQNFFDNILTTFCPTLECLTICSHPGLNYDFLFKFESLVLVTIAHELPVNFVKKVVDHFPDLERFAFNYQSQYIQVCICGQKRKILYLGDNAPIEFEELNELFDHLVLNQTSLSKNVE